MTEQLVNVRCFSHVGVSVGDLERSVEFYMGLFGFEKRFENREDGWARVGLRVGDVQLELFSPHPGRQGDVLDPYYPIQFGRPKLALTVDDVTATYARLVGAGIKPLCSVVTTPASRFFFIEDPDGTPIQLHEFNGGVLRVVDLFR
jgi:catechol 2,3-dioxygenase-like lactoylglutathione lyase family enzyme